MKRLFCVLLAAATLGIQAAAQSITIQPINPYEGSISTPGGSERWTFSGLEGGVISVLVTSTSDLDPIVELRNASGQLIAANDDFAYPGRRDALLQAVTLPRIDTYFIDVSGYGETVGDYTLTMLPGYAEIALRESFSSITGWQASGSATAAISDGSGQLLLTLDGTRQVTRIERDMPDAGQDFYAQARFDIQRAPVGWRVGFALRGTDAGYYALALNGEGAWRMDYIAANGTSRQIRDWTVHPAIRRGATGFMLGVLANGRAFDVFFDNAWVGQAVESQDATPDAGTIGFYAATPDAVGAGIAAAFDELLVTRPMRLGESEIMPGLLAPGGQALTIQELERRRVIPTGGTLALTVPESSGRQVEPGVSRVLLGRGATFENYVLHTTFTLTTAQPDALVGCGLLFASATDTRHAIAFLDRQGGYGLSTRDGENYSPGLFGENTAFAGGGRRHSLIVVKSGQRAELFVDRQHVGGIDLPENFGAPAQIGNAVINYERSDTSCSFGDTWVWTFTD